MNHQTATLILESDGETKTRKKNKSKHRFNERVCPELDNIGFHIIRDNNVCVYCGYRETLGA